MIKKMSLVLVFVILMATFTGCGDKTDTTKESQEILKWDIGPEPYSLDPQLNFDDGGNIINNTFEGLMREVDGEIVPGIAEDYEVSENGKLYTFYLRKALWSDGEPVTAHDFVYAWRRACNPNLEPSPSRFAYQLFPIKGAQDAVSGKGTLEEIGINALDDNTLQVELMASTPYFLDLTTFYTYMPVRKDVVEKDPTGWAINPEVIASNGPFVMTQYKTGESLTLTKNENYWQSEKVNLDKIEGYMISDENSMLSAYEAGEVDIIVDVPIQEIPRLKKENTDFYILPLIGTYYYVFNTQKLPLDNPLVRKALSYSIDRTAIAENISQGGEKPASGIVPSGLSDAEGNDFRATAGDYGIDLGKGNYKRAKELLAEAGYPNGEGFPVIDFIYNSEGAHKAVAEAIQEMWNSNLGIKINILNQEWGVLADNLYTGNYNIARSGWIADYADPTTMLDVWLSYSGNNEAKWNNSGYDKIMELSKGLSGQERFELLYAAEEVLMDDMIIAPIYYYTDTVMVKDYVKNWQKTKLGLWFFGYAYIEKTK